MGVPFIRYVCPIAGLKKSRNAHVSGLFIVQGGDDPEKNDKYLLAKKDKMPDSGEPVFAASGNLG